MSSSSRPRETQWWGMFTQVLNSRTGPMICAGSAENLLSREINSVSWELRDAAPLFWAKMQFGNPWCISWSLTHEWWSHTGQGHKSLLHRWHSPWEIKHLLRGQRVASSGSQAWGNGREHHARGMAVVELGHFSTSGLGWVLECGKVPRNSCHVQNQPTKT